MFSLHSEKSTKKISLCNQTGLRFEFLENGSVYSIMHHEILVNQVLGNIMEGSLNNIYLRRHSNGKIEYFPLVGANSTSRFFAEKDYAEWLGEGKAFSYRCRLHLHPQENIWFWTLKIINHGAASRKFDLVLSQDLGLAAKGGVRLNEAYVSQYIDHTVLSHPQYGFLICSRQNQAQNQLFPWIMHGCLFKSAGYLTDGFQFFGLEYKVSNQPEILAKEKFPNQVLQYEFAYPTLLSKQFTLAPNCEKEIVFFADFLPNHPNATGPKDAQRLRKIAASAKHVMNQKYLPSTSSEIISPKTVFANVEAFPTQELTAKEINRFFPGEKRNVETIRGKTLSFFYSDHCYVALRAKELMMERPHGSIICSGEFKLPNEEILSSTAFMYGIFNSQLTIGNTSFSKLLSVSRNSLNVLKTCGQRIFVETETGFKLLGMPSAMEQGLNFCRWIYKDRLACLVVTTWTAADNPAIFLEIKVVEGKPKRFLISHQIVLGNNEGDSSGQVKVSKTGCQIELIPAPSEFLISKYPESRFYIVSPQANQLEFFGDDRLLYHDRQSRRHPYITMKTKPVRKFTLAITGNILDRNRASSLAKKYSTMIPTLEKNRQSSRNYWGGLCKNPVLTGRRKDASLDRLNDIFYWFSHNAMIHYLIPHGLEQYTGAAWGLRDVCQGPVEFMVCTQNHHVLREIIKIVYSHQFFETGDWPQWFMFDRFQEVQAPDSHGDIVIWPIKAVCDYIESTNDFTVLNELIPYTSVKTKMFTAVRQTLLEHIRKQIAKLKSDCIRGTSLVSYGHGDWEDTLQPADPSMRKQMVSSWTVELMYQTLNRFSNVCEKGSHSELAFELSGFCRSIQEDFQRYLIKQEVVAGLAYFHKKKRVEYLLHPSDKRIGIKYRLLPMTRGMISGLLSLPQAVKHYSIIKRHLYFPDGVRLMEKPIPYKGGVEQNFKRAETAANFGREIGLQYVHAQIRFLEAMAKLGKAEELWHGFFVINPILIEKTVPKAVTRQSNSYFSSSDAAFMDRYQAENQFAELRKGKIGTKGGWRIYSSGPGIYLNQLISNCLGLRTLFEDFVFDPVLPRKLDGLSFDFVCEAKKVRYQYRIRKNECSPDGLIVNGKEMKGERWLENPYRRGGLLVNKNEYVSLLTQKENQVVILL